MSTELVRSTPATAQALEALVRVLTEDAVYVLAAGGGSASLPAVARRRAEAYEAAREGTTHPGLTHAFDAWLVDMARVLAPIAPPQWLPMSEVIREKVTLEVGARGLRSLFSSKPSDKDVQRVKRYGTLAARLLRAVFAADGPIDAEEARAIRAFVTSLGLPEGDVAGLFQEPPVAPEQLDVYGDLDQGVGRALVRGAWFAAAWDAVDPREEHVVRTFAEKIAMPLGEVEMLRADALARVERQRALGVAAVDAVRVILIDRAPGVGIQIAANVGALMLPRRFREEVLAQVGHGSPVTLAGRHTELSSEDKETVLLVAWACALHENPTMTRKAQLRARHDRVAADLGFEGVRPRVAMEEWVGDTLAPAASRLM